MPQDKRENSNDTPGQAGEALVGELANVVAAALGVGAGIAKTVAQATAGNQPVPEPEPQSNPLKAIVHYGMATAMNFVGLVTRSVHEAGNTAGTARQTPGAGEAPAGGPAKGPAPVALPSVHQGATLRVPLSIENPGAEPMTGLHFVCAKLEGGNTAGKALTCEAVQLQPATMTVLPHDFEKLTILIAVPGDAAPGRYHAIIGLEGGGLNTVLEFEVLTAAA